MSEQRGHLFECLAIDECAVESPDARYSTHNGRPLLNPALQRGILLREVIDYCH